MPNYVLQLQILNEDLRPLYEGAIKMLNSEEYLRNPHKDSGFDLFIPRNPVQEGGVSVGDYRFSTGETRLIDLGIRCAAYRMKGEQKCGPKSAWKGQPFCIYPRSSIYKSGFRLANNVGVVDSGYRGNIMGAFDNVVPASRYKMKCMRPRPPYTALKSHIRLLQICMPDLQPFSVKVVDSLDTTSRGSGGFGSTGT